MNFIHSSVSLDACNAKNCLSNDRLLTLLPEPWIIWNLCQIWRTRFPALWLDFATQRAIKIYWEFAAINTLNWNISCIVGNLFSVWLLLMFVLRRFKASRSYKLRWQNTKFWLMKSRCRELWTSRWRRFVTHKLQNNFFSVFGFISLKGFLRSRK